MRPGKILWSLLSSLLVLSACDDKKDDFSGLSNLVEKRNEVRQTLSAKKALEKQQLIVGSKENTRLNREKKKAEISPIVLYERNIEVVDSTNRMPLAKGIAYLNKEGRIVKIKILKD